jgi:hypothetical protein
MVTTEHTSENGVNWQRTNLSLLKDPDHGILHIWGMHHQIDDSFTLKLDYFTGNWGTADSRHNEEVRLEMTPKQARALLDHLKQIVELDKGDSTGITFVHHDQ